MSSEAPPTYNVSVFIPSYWVSSTEGFDKAYADTHYLKFPVGQGTEYIPDLVVSGTTTLGATSVSSLNMSGGNITNVVNINGSAYPPSTGTGDIDAVLAVGNQATNKTMIMNGAGGGGSSNNLQLDGDGAFFYGAFSAPQTSTLSKTGLIFNSGATDCNITKDGITLVLDNANPTTNKTEIYSDGIDLTGSSATITNKLTPISSIIADGTYTATLISNALSLFTNSVSTTRNAITNTGVTITGSTTSVLNTIVASSNTITDGVRTLFFGISSTIATIKLNAAASLGNAVSIVPNSIGVFGTDGTTTMNASTMTPTSIQTIGTGSSDNVKLIPNDATTQLLVSTGTTDWNNTTAKGQLVIQTSSTLGGGISYTPSILFKRVGNSTAIGGGLGTLRFCGYSNITGTQIEYGRITTSIKAVGSSLEDGRMLFQTSLNSVLTDFLDFDGGEEQINAYKPIDMNNNSIVSSTGGITLNASGSSGTGVITLNTKNGTAGSGTGLVLSGNTLTVTATGPNTQEPAHLCLYLPDPLTGLSKLYKIQLLA